jgi:hypothetical protein
MVDVPRRSAWVLAAFSAALDLALVVAAFGFVSLLTDAEVIPSAAAGPLVGPLAIGASVAVLLLHLARALRTPERMLAPTLLAGLYTWLAAVVVADVGYAFATGAVLGSLIFGLSFGVGPFGLLIPACAMVVTVIALLVARAQSEGARRPRWPWERDEDV